MEKVEVREVERPACECPECGDFNDHLCEKPASGDVVECLGCGITCEVE